MIFTKALRILAASAVVSLAAAVPVAAHHNVYLDFSEIDEIAEFPWDTINGNTTTQADIDTVLDLIVQQMVEDYATFDIHFMTSEPKTGRYTKVRLLASSQSAYGKAGPSTGCSSGGGFCCDCTRIGSWNQDWSADASMRKSQCEVYTGTFAGRSAWMGDKATTARISRALSGTAGHELGHVLSLVHCDANDSYEASGSTSDSNRNWHVMATWNKCQTMLTDDTRATRDRFFSVHSSRRVLYDALQVRNHWSVIGDFDGEILDDFAETSDTRLGSDLAYGPLEGFRSGPDEWRFRMTTGSGLRSPSDHADNVDFPDGKGLYLTNYLQGKVIFDMVARLVYGRIESADIVKWRAHSSAIGDLGGQGAGAGFSNEWSSDGGDAGDIFRLADVDSNNVDDLVYGRVMSPSTVKWIVHVSNGTSFGSGVEWSSDAGDDRDLFILADLAPVDGMYDLVTVDRHTSSTVLEVSIYESDGTQFSWLSTDSLNVSAQPDYVMLGDVDFDADDDLVLGFVKADSNTRIDWSVALNQSCSGSGCFAAPAAWATDRGDAGDIVRLGDLDGDDGPLVAPKALRFDLVYAKHTGLNNETTTPDLTRTYRWSAGLSDGSSFGTETFWGNAGGEGFQFP